MLCAFASQNDLRNCLSAVQAAFNSDLSDVLVFRAKPRPYAVSDAYIEESVMTPKNDGSDADMDGDDAVIVSEDGEEGDVYALSIKSSDKVRVLHDWRGMAELRKQFPNIDHTMINDIWKQQKCWQACFDVLSSLVKSHGSILIEQCDFVVDDIHFPALTLSPSSHLLCQNNNQHHSYQSSRSGSHDWTIVSLEHSFSTMSVGSSDNDSNYQGHGIQKWEMVASPLVVSTQKGSGFSYKDALLKPAVVLSRAEDDIPKKRTWDDLIAEQANREWKPIFVITKVANVRPDREYVNDIYELDDDEAGMYIIFFVSANYFYHSLYLSG